jgi:hypothetical protein
LAGGSTASRFPYSIPSAGVLVFQTDGSWSVVRTGWVKVAPDPAHLRLSGSAFFRLVRHSFWEVCKVYSREWPLILRLLSKRLGADVFLRQRPFLEKV